MKNSYLRNGAALVLSTFLLTLASCGQKNEAEPAAGAKPVDQATKTAANEDKQATDASAQPTSSTATAAEIDSDDAGPNPEHGKRVFAKCAVCHSVEEGKNGAGPSLYDVVGSAAGQKAGFNYSSAMANSGIVWTDDVLAQYLENPAKFLPGNKMGFPGLPSPGDRADVIAYLKSTE